MSDSNPDPAGPEPRQLHAVPGCGQPLRGEALLMAIVRGEKDRVEREIAALRMRHATLRVLQSPPALQAERCAWATDSPHLIFLTSQ